MTSPAAFSSELIRAANEIDRLTKEERTGLLFRASATIRDMREDVDLPGTQNGDDELDDIGVELTEMARLVFMFKPSEIAAKLLEGAEAIRTLTILMGIKDDVSGET